MQATSMENMRRCMHRYVSGGPLDRGKKTAVIEICGSSSGPYFQAIVEDCGFRHQVARVVGAGAEAQLRFGDSVPLKPESVDVVMAAATATNISPAGYGEALRLLRRDGLGFLITPASADPEGSPQEQQPFNRIYQDIAIQARCILLENRCDPRGPIRDWVGVFRRADAPAFTRAMFRKAVIATDYRGLPGSSAEEAWAGHLDYLQVLDRLHRELAPRQYLEIGVRTGASLALARCRATGVDPAPAIKETLGSQTQLITATSDEFFESEASDLSLDLAFIDGMHLFEFALRDFMNIERRAAAGAVVAIDDIFPNHPVQAERQRRSRTWTGDVWRFVELLRAHRPDLYLQTLDTTPTGLLFVAGLDPSNRVLWQRYNELVEQAARDPAAIPARVLQRQGALHPTGHEAERFFLRLRELRSSTLKPAELVARLRQPSG